MKYRRLYLVLIFFIFIIQNAPAQTGVGLPFLKISSGARQAGMGDAFTGVSDDVYALQWNPGGLGHIRRWQWSASYNRWFTDVYQATFSFVQQYRALKSRKASWGGYISYLGMPPWDATGGLMPSVQAQHLVAGLAVGQRLDWLHPTLAFGASIKGIYSTMDDFTSKGVAMDVGMLYRSNRFSLGPAGFGIVDYGYFSIFDQSTTELPLTYRIGGSLRVGRYDDWTVLLASDWVLVKNRDWVPAVGSEVWWKDLIGGRMGYRFNDQDLGEFSFGFGFRLDDMFKNTLNLPTRFSDRFEFNLADAPYGDVLDQTYRGSVTHYPIAPEPFYLEEATEFSSEVQDMSQVLLTWETTIDPDPFDDVNYMLIIDKDPEKVKHAVSLLEHDMVSFLKSKTRDNLYMTLQTPNTSYVFKPEDGGMYHWAVAAYDRAYHARLAKKGKENFAGFLVAVPDLWVRDIQFQYSHWITTTPEQGNLLITIENQGTADADSFRLVILDTYLDAPGLSRQDTLQSIWIGKVENGVDTLFQIPWETPYIGRHQISAIVDPDSLELEINEANNRTDRRFISIPKGQILASDSVEVMATGYDSTEIPVVPEVYFGINSDVVGSEYMTPFESIPSILMTLTERLHEHPEVTLSIMGSIDHLSGERDLALAENRAYHVKQELIHMGVPASQLNVVVDHPDKILAGRVRTDPDDARWASEQNRVVTFSVPQQDEVKLFRPIPVAVDTTLRDSVRFKLRIVSPAQTASWKVHGDPPPISTEKVLAVAKDSLWQQFSWNGTNRQKVLVPRNRWYPYFITLVDTMGREFYTRPDSIYLKEKRTIRRKEVFGSAKFAQVEPVYQFYWDRLEQIAMELADNPAMHIRFEGHACAIGPKDVNMRLSERRAKRFTEAFKNRLRRLYPAQYASIEARIESPEGFGETEPLIVKLKDVGEVLLGDNEHPVGRFYNRRISVLLYREN